MLDFLYRVYHDRFYYNFFAGVHLSVYPTHLLGRE